MFGIQGLVVGHHNLVAIGGEFIRPAFPAFGRPLHARSPAMISVATAVGDGAAGRLVLVKGHVEHQTLTQAGRGDGRVGPGVSEYHSRDGNEGGGEDDCRYNDRGFFHKDGFG